MEEEAQSYVFQNAVQYEDGRIDCEISHPRLGWIQYTADPADVDPAGLVTHAAILASGDYTVLPPPPPAWLLAQARANASMTKGEFALALYAVGVLSFEDADLAASGGWPAAFTGAIEMLPDVEKLQAKILWRTAVNVERMDPLLLAVQAHMIANPDLPDLTAEDLDAMFGITLTG